jgi:hypothetical protein
LIVICILSLVAIAFCTYHNILSYYYTDVDTFDLIWYGRLNSLTDIWRIFSSNVGGGPHFYRPVSQLTFAIDNAIWKDNPFGYHLTDVIFHVLTTVFFFWLAVLLLPPSKMRCVSAWLAAGLFAISPAGLSVIASITNRHDAIAAFFSLVCLGAASKAMLQKGSNLRWYVLSLISGGLAIFSKESTYVLPMLVGFYCLTQPARGWAVRIRETIKWSAPLAMLVLLSMWLHTAVTGRMPSMAASTYLMHLRAGVMYAFFLLQPAELVEINIYFKALLLILLLLLLGLSLIFIWNNVRKGLVDATDLHILRLAGWLLLFMASYGLIYISFGQFGQRYAYMPAVAFSLFLVCLLLYRGTGVYARWMRRSVAVVFIAYTVLYSPMFRHYGAWERSSQISRIIVTGIEDAISRDLADKSHRTVYLVNLPVFLDYRSGIMNEGAGVLRDYTLDAWAKMLKLRTGLDVSIKTISHIRMYESAQRRAAIDYEVGDKKILMHGRSITIPLKGFGKLEGMPLTLGFSGNQPEFRFNRCFKENEALLLFDGESVKIHNWHWIAAHVYPCSETPKAQP